MSKNIVICLDGTNNEPESSHTNVARLYEMVAQNDRQIGYYDPGVGTMGARSATTRLGKFATRVNGLALGHGVKENIEEAYRFLMQTYRKGDQVFLFGFSRGAYTARALAGMLRTVGLLRSGAENLIPYALKLYAKQGDDNATDAEEEEFWRVRTDFNTTFGNPEFPNRFAPQVQFLGLWDTVKFVGWLNWRAQLQQARWPFTRKVPNVVTGRHALALHEKRRYYAEYRFDGAELSSGQRDLEEVWFTGVHSDVGGTFDDDHRLADISLQWIADEARAAGLEVDEAVYEKHVTVPPGKELPDSHADGLIHKNSWMWAVVGAGWRTRKPNPGDAMHKSVTARSI